MVTTLGAEFVVRDDEAVLHPSMQYEWKRTLFAGALAEEGSLRS
ncbi:hypothetical protein ACTWQF_17430 [Streptomyces sp. 8N114]